MLDSMTFDWNASFFDLLHRFRQTDAIANDDLVAAVRNLMEEVHEVHEAGNVADLERVDLLALGPNGELSLGKIPVGQPVPSTTIATTEVTTPVDTPASSADDPSSFEPHPTIAQPGTPPAMPAYYAGYSSWERAAGHHDALTDIFHLGLLIASLATRLDFREPAAVATFARHRTNLTRVCPRLHPVLGRVIADMTALRRADRAADLGALIDLVDDYRSLEVDDAEAKAGDFADLADLALRRQRTQQYFRNRLFEVTRRNKLLYFSDRHGVDLTRGSFPVMLNYEALQPRQLLTTGPDLLSRLRAIHDGGEPRGELDLRRWLRCADYSYLAPNLDKIRSAARRDSRELGFNQLRLVLAFLRWHDDEKGERISSPLVLLPVSLRKQAGTADGFCLVLEASVTEAEINPVLRYVLADRFRVELPDTIDMTSLDALKALRQLLETDVRRQLPGVTIRLAERPRIQHLQSTIKRHIEDHRRRQRRSAQRMKDWRGVAYSYASESYDPLGYELFDRFVRPGAAPVGDPPDIEPPQLEPRLFTPSATADATAYEAGEPTDPRDWEIDLCAVSLANFNTRKMSLVRDYETLDEGYAGPHANYKRLFEQDARPALRPIEKPPHTGRNFVLPSDPSQDEAILRAAGGESYVIQGPPGTGKSQTIANLLADLAAKGKSVLFVCEKRVALDVVHDRLKDAGIGDLASLVHDAREDRLPFIADLKGLYESWLASRTSRTIRDRHAALAAEIDAFTARLGMFSSAMQRSVGAGDTTVRDLMGLSIANAFPRSRLSLREREAAPPWGAFVEGETALSELEARLEHVACDRAAVVAVLASLRTDLVDLDQPLAHLDAAIREARRGLSGLSGLLDAMGRLEPGRELRIGSLVARSRLAAQLKPLAAAGRLGLLDRYAPDAARLSQEIQDLDALDAAVAAAETDNTFWKRKPSRAEVASWLAIARRNEGRLWSSLSPQWRTLRRQIKDEIGVTAPSIVRVLELLAAEQAARSARDRKAQLIYEAFGLDDVAEARAILSRVWHDDSGLRPEERALIDAAAADPGAHAPIILGLATEQRRIEGLQNILSTMLARPDDAVPSTLERDLGTLDVIKEQAVDLAAGLRALEQASPALCHTWRRVPMPLGTMRAAALHMELQRSLAHLPDVQRTTSTDILGIAQQIGNRLAELRQLNARRTIDERKSRFRAHGAARDDEYDVGCAFLEHQFSLQRPSAALRDFLTGAPALVVRDLKPIWMMSPLSVADTLPLDEALFDVVVFDEASQIPIEDAVPTLYRARQMIVVGDEMQLPPPSYFGRKHETDDNDLPDYIAYGMQAESLLDKAAAALPSTRLEWHYRSRHESLIGFCNQAFYAGRLKTIPSRQIVAPSPPIEVGTVAPMKELAFRVLSRPISFHRVPDARYVDQRNLAEAAYIADLVRGLLGQDASKSIGIVSFSQAQQAAIEEALERLAGDNPTFRARLERAMASEQEELFVKNLENVQGDERDIVIVSVAYGPGQHGRMIMNFGPINQDGGEKRLNVIFSRAKHHVVVVTSFDPSQITNDWNKGANALKRYLMYAAAASTGDADGMRAAVAGYPGADHVDRSAQQADPLADMIAASLRNQGRDAVRGLGQSTARCDIAVKDRGGSTFSTAILTDNAAHYQISDVVDRYVTYPGLLRASGWKVELALAKDWISRIPRAEPSPDEKQTTPRPASDGGALGGSADQPTSPASQSPGT